MQIARPPSHPSSSRHNRPLKVHFKLPVIKKASPTVSLTSTNAARANTAFSPPSPSILAEVSSPSSIPFPSSPIPCPTRKRALSEDRRDFRNGGEREDEPMDVDEPQGNTLPFHRRISHIDILRKRSKSCLASSYFHSDSHAPRNAKHESDVPASEEPEAPAKKRHHVRRESMSAGNPAVTSKTVRKAKRVFADAQFLASMHSSIALQVRARIDRGTRPGPAGDDCAAQDVVLVERLWKALVDMGYKPVPLDPSPPLPMVSRSNADPAREAAERAARRTEAVSSMSTAIGSIQDLPVAPSGTVAVPQLVATLIMRHRDRSATRPRAAAKRQFGEDRVNPPLSRSPLSTMFIPATES